MVLHTNKPFILIFEYKSTEFSIPKDNWYWIKKNPPVDHESMKTGPNFHNTSEKKGLIRTLISK